MSGLPRYFILTGEPGVGKTTLVNKLVDKIGQKHVFPVGFYTEEVRKNRTRVGFDVVTLEGERAPLARSLDLMKDEPKYTVGKYGVLLNDFESLAFPAIKKALGSNALLVIDEIGKMELFSENFANYIKSIFNANSKSIVLATIPLRKSQPLVENIRNNINTRIWTVTRENRSVLHEEVFTEMSQFLKLRE